MTSDSGQTKGPAESALHDFALGKIDPARKSEIEAYIADHPEAADQVAEFRAEAEELRALLGNAMHSADTQDAPTDFALARLMDGSLPEEQRDALLTQLTDSPDALRRLAEMAKSAVQVSSDAPIPTASAPKPESSGPPISLDEGRKAIEAKDQAQAEKTLDDLDADDTAQSGGQQI